MTDQKSGNKEISLRDHGIYLLTEQINTTNVKPVIEWILKENLTPKKKEYLQLVINSPGGSCAASFSLTDVMEGSKVPIHTIGLGQISSCGLLIFMAGQQGERTLTPNTLILSHQYSGGAVGKDHELVAARKRQDLVHDMMVRHYRKHTKLKKDVIHEKLLPKSDVYLNAKEAKDLNLCDNIKLL
jgi:ATP-dependent Clp protease protease subunit